MCLQRSSSFGMSDEILSVLYFQKLNNCDMMSYSIVLVQMSKLEEMFNFYKRSKACANPITGMGHLQCLPFSFGQYYEVNIAGAPFL